MPDYPSGQTTHGITMTQTMLPTFQVGTGFGLVCTCPQGKSWHVETISLQNNHATKTFVAHLQLVPYNWIGTVATAGLSVFQNVVLKPRQLLIMNYTLGLTAGTAFWGYQAEDVTSATLQGVVLVIAGTETG